MASSLYSCIQYGHSSQRAKIRELGPLKQQVAKILETYANENSLPYATQACLLDAGTTYFERQPSMLSRHRLLGIDILSMPRKAKR